MELKITNDRENALMGRREITFYIDGEEKTPSAAAGKKELCKKLNLDPESTIVTKVEQRFGMRRAECAAHSYKEHGAMERNEPAHLLERVKKRSAKQDGAAEPKAEQEQKAKPEAEEEAAEAAK